MSYIPNKIYVGKFGLALKHKPCKALFCLDESFSGLVNQLDYLSKSHIISSSRVCGTCGKILREEDLEETSAIWVPETYKTVSEKFLFFF